MSNSIWRVVDFKPHSKGTLRGFFSLQIGGVVFKGFSLHKKEDTGSRWVGLPSREYVEDGVKKYAPQVEFTDKARREAFQKWALGELDKLAGGQR